MTSAPLSLLPYQSGLVVTPLVESAAQGQGSLDGKQRAIVIGEPVPIVFGRRVGNVGGVFVSPGATEGRFENDPSTNTLEVYWQLVLSEGELERLQVRDLFRGGCRQGEWKQAYDARASNWEPGNFIVEPTDPDAIPWAAPQYCGTGGTYDNVTTLSYNQSYLDGDPSWDWQLHAFVRGGMQVTRILDNTFGPSNNVVDLALYLIRQSSRFPEEMIDLAAMEDAARFTDVNGFFYNGIFKDSTNLEDWLQQTASSFLLRLVDRAGKKALKPRVPVNADGTINTNAIPWVFTFTEDHVMPDGFEISYIPLAERKPIAAQMLWRQQPEDDIGLIRTAEVRFVGEAVNGAFEQYDLSVFCASENHAVKVGAYYVARRKLIEHTLRLRVRPASFNPTIEQGDIVRVLLKRETTTGSVTQHNYLYEVERIGRDISGSVEFDLTHFPVNAAGQSIVAVYVNETVGNGFELDVGRADYDCDFEGRRDDESLIDLDPFTDLDLPDFEDFVTEMPLPDVVGGSGIGGGAASPGGGFEPGEEPEDPEDPLEEEIVPQIQGASGPDGQPVEGDTLTLPDICPGMKTEWFLFPTDGGDPIQVAQGVAEPYIVGSSGEFAQLADTEFRVLARGCCPDPGAPGGFATCQESELTPPISLLPGADAVVRWLGTGREDFNWSWTVQQASGLFLTNNDGVDNSKTVSGLTWGNVTLPNGRIEPRVYINYTDGSRQESCASKPFIAPGCNNHPPESPQTVIVNLSEPGVPGFTQIPPDIVYN